MNRRSRSLSFESKHGETQAAPSTGRCACGVLTYRIDGPLRNVMQAATKPGVNVRFIQNRSALGRPDPIVIPGSKATVNDLAWMGEQGSKPRGSKSVKFAILGSRLTAISRMYTPGFGT